MRQYGRVGFSPLSKELSCTAFSTYNNKLCIALCKGNSKHCTGFPTADNKPCITPSTPTWRAGDEENGEGQFGGVSHFPSESDPLTRKRILKKTISQNDKSQIKCLAAQQSTVSQKRTFLKCQDRAWIKNIPIMPALLVQKKKGGRGGGLRRRGDGCWYFQVYRQAMEGDLLAFKPGLSCTCKVCSIVMNRRVHLCLLVFNLLFSDQRSREPSHSRAGLTSIGLEIKRTPLSNQTSPRQAMSHSFKTSKRRWNEHFQSRTDKTWNSKHIMLSLLLYSVWKPQFRPTVRLGCPATTSAPSAPRGNQPITKHPVRSKVCQKAFLGRNDLNEQVETLSYDSNNL